MRLCNVCEPRQVTAELTFLTFLVQDAWGGFRAWVVIDLSQAAGGSSSAILQALQVGRGEERGRQGGGLPEVGGSSAILQVLQVRHAWVCGCSSCACLKVPYL